MRTWIIYIHTSEESGKSYIGTTHRSILERWTEHIKETKGGSTRHFHRAIRLYGVHNWKHETLCDNITTLEEAYALEKYFIKKHNTFESGYNLSVGGEGCSTGILGKYRKALTWYHDTQGKVVCTPAELCTQYEVPVEGVRNLLKGVYKSTYGWALKKEVTKKKYITYDLRAEVTAYHETLGTFTGTLEEFKKVVDKPFGHITKLLNKKYKAVAGWRLSENVHIPVYKKVYGFDSASKELVVIYPSSFEASRQLSLPRKETMCEWLGSSCGKLYNNIIYTYDVNYIINKGR